VVGLRPERLGGLDDTWDKEERVFVGHSDKLHAFFVP